MTVSIRGDGYSACLVIDSIVNDTSSGGVRVADSVSLDEVATLAREMTLKFASYRLLRGGAKMGVSIPSSAGQAEKSRILNDLGRRLGPIIRTGVYNPGMDMNCGPDDLRAIYRGAGIELGRITDSSYFTAMGLESALEACRDHWNCAGPVSLAVEGFGRVAGHLAARLDPAKYKIVAASTLCGAVRNQSGFDLRMLSEKRDQTGDAVVKELAGEAIDKELVYSEPVDVLIPSSRTWAINSQNVIGVTARAVVPIANAPYADGTIASLQGRGAMCLPGFITNAGGVFGSSLYDSGLSRADVETLTRQCVQPVIRRLIELSDELGVSPVELAEQAARKEVSVRGQRGLPRGMAEAVLRRLRPYLPKGVGRNRAKQRFIAGLSALKADLESVAAADDRAAGQAPRQGPAARRK